MSSNGMRSLPSFGISKKPKHIISENVTEETTSIVPDLSNNSNVLPPRSRTVTNVPSNVSNVSNVTGTSNVSNGTSTTRKVGDLMFNDKDTLMYYYNGKEWKPLAIMDDELRHLTETLAEIMNIKDTNTVVIEAPPRGNIHLIAGNNSPGSGGHVLVSAGHGGLADGEIYFTVGGEQALTITKNAEIIVNSANIQVDRGDLVIKAGNLELEDPSGTINCNIATQTVTMIAGDSEEQKSTIPDAILNSMTSILSVNLKLEKDENITGVIKNSLLKTSSWVNVTASTSTGIPYVFLDKPMVGEIKYTIHCINGSLANVDLHFEVRNCV